MTTSNRASLAAFIAVALACVVVLHLPLGNPPARRLPPLPGWHLIAGAELVPARTVVSGPALVRTTTRDVGVPEHATIPATATGTSGTSGSVGPSAAAVEAVAIVSQGSDAGSRTADAAQQQTRHPHQHHPASGHPQHPHPQHPHPQHPPVPPATTPPVTDPPVATPPTSPPPATPPAVAVPAVAVPAVAVPAVAVPAVAIPAVVMQPLSPVPPAAYPAGEAPAVRPGYDRHRWGRSEEPDAVPARFGSCAHGAGFSGGGARPYR
ncbi:hypothetical protein P5P86_10255 [Nocardioides sp. BP30]|uniref:hypothetical protein n=1 Tax=Nocardioides sp. BP30 TaxID=3036374 RepID=UPI0024698C2F|nr:hypothetical protein [Nocardioides sp. BP30]WGL50351.1 hypothetical protein P5P86_10255 [Nocardioides sp. BP30]